MARWLWARACRFRALPSGIRGSDGRTHRTRGLVTLGPRLGPDVVCLAGEAALCDSVGTAFGVGQHIKLHTRLCRPRATLDALRNFRTSVADWRRRLSRRRGCDRAAAASEELDELGRLGGAWLASLQLGFTARADSAAAGVVTRTWSLCP